jgi:hypothetical protein
VFSGLGNFVPPVVSGPVKPVVLTKAQKLLAALKACRSKAKKRRASCEVQARKKYGPKPKTKAKRKKSSGRSK